MKKEQLNFERSKYVISNKKELITYFRQVNDGGNRNADIDVLSQPKVIIDHLSEDALEHIDKQIDPGKKFSYIKKRDDNLSQDIDENKEEEESIVESIDSFFEREEQILRTVSESSEDVHNESLDQEQDSKPAYRNQENEESHIYFNQEDYQRNESEIGTRVSSDIHLRDEVLKNQQQGQAGATKDNNYEESVIYEGAKLEADSKQAAKKPAPDSSQRGNDDAHETKFVRNGRDIFPEKQSQNFNIVGSQVVGGSSDDKQILDTIAFSTPAQKKGPFQKAVQSLSNIVKEARDVSNAKKEARKAKKEEKKRPPLSF